MGFRLWLAKLDLFFLARSEAGRRFLSLTENWVEVVQMGLPGVSENIRLRFLADKLGSVGDYVLAHEFGFSPSKVSVGELNRILVNTNLLPIGLTRGQTPRRFLQIAIEVIFLRIQSLEQKAR